MDHRGWTSPFSFLNKKYRLWSNIQWYNIIASCNRNFETNQSWGTKTSLVLLMRINWKSKSPTGEFDKTRRVKTSEAPSNWKSRFKLTLWVWLSNLALYSWRPLQVSPLSSALLFFIPCWSVRSTADLIFPPAFMWSACVLRGTLVPPKSKLNTAGKKNNARMKCHCRPIFLKIYPGFFPPRASWLSAKLPNRVCTERRRRRRRRQHQQKYSDTELSLLIPVSAGFHHKISSSSCSCCCWWWWFEQANAAFWTSTITIVNLFNN